jgi:hypothetical protein
MGKQYPRTAGFHLGSILMASLICASADAADAGYVAAIKADVAEFTTHEFQAPPDSAWIGSGDEASQGEGSQLMDLESFSTFLQKKSPGSYIFYKKLPVEYKEKLRSDYLSTGDLDRIKQDIFKYSREVKRN